MEAAQHVNETISEIGNPKSEAKLTGIQEVVYAVDQEIIAARKAIDERRGVVAASAQIANRIRQELEGISARVRDETLEHDEGKIRSEQTKKIVGICDEIARNNQTDLQTLIGKLQGLERANALAEERFKTEVLKVERRKRMEEEDAAEEAELRGSVEAEHGGNGKDNGAATHKSKKRRRKG